MNAATFFVPKGRLNRSQFQMAALVLVAIGFVSALGGLVPGATAAMAIGSLTTLIGLVTIYMWVVVWIKRLHNANVTGWMTILLALGYFLLSQIVTTVVSSLVAPEMSDAVANAMMNDGFMAMMEVSAEYGPQLALPVGIAGAILSLAYALLFNAVLKNDPDENRYGPAPQ